MNANTALRGNATSNLVVRNDGRGVPLSLITAGNGKPPMKVDSRRLVRNLNADKVDFRDANELIRADFEMTTSALDQNGHAVFATVEAPRPGYLIMGGSIDASGDTDDEFLCQLVVDNQVLLGTQRIARVGDAAGDHTSNSQENCSTDGGWAVAAGTHMVYLNIANRDTASFGQASVWTIWVPFDGDGLVPTP